MSMLSFVALYGMVNLIAVAAVSRAPMLFFSGEPYCATGTIARAQCRRGAAGLGFRVVGGRGIAFDVA